jgi:hypothetical protein
VATVTRIVEREGGRPCGCDPKLDHICEGHAAYRDLEETEVGTAYAYDEDFATEDADRAQIPVEVVVSGPDADGEIMLLGAQHLYLSRFVAEDLAHEILKRLKERVG